MVSIIFSNDFLGKNTAYSELDLKINDSIVFECENGLFIGTVNSINDAKVNTDFNILRIASKKDISDFEKNNKKYYLMFVRLLKN